MAQEEALFRRFMPEQHAHLAVHLLIGMAFPVPFQQSLVQEVPSRLVPLERDV